MEINSGGTADALNAWAPDGLIGRKFGTWEFYAYDPQGNVAQRTDASGAVQSNSAYDAYGAEVWTGTRSEIFSYNARWGYVADRETGLYYCQNRYYDPGNGRWVTRDPVGVSGGLNLYGYCWGEPLQTVDPQGERGTGTDTQVEPPPYWWPKDHNLPGKIVGGGAAATIGGQVVVAAATFCAAAGIGTGIGYVGGSALDDATGGGWGRWWGEHLGLIAPENNADVSRVHYYDYERRRWGQPFYLHTGDDDCDWELELNERTCRKFKNKYKARACWARAYEIFSECKGSKRN